MTSTTMNEKLEQTLLDLRDDLNIFHTLDEEELKQLAGEFELKHCPAKTVLFKEGEPGDYIGLILSGRFEVKKTTEFKGKQIVIAVLSRGSSVGEMSIIDEKPRSATMVAIEDSELLIMRREALNDFIERNPRIGIKILREINRILAIRLRGAIERITALF